MDPLWRVRGMPGAWRLLHAVESFVHRLVEQSAP